MNATSVPTSNIGIAAINLGFGWAKISLDGVEEKFMSVVSPHQKSIAMMVGKTKNQLNLVHLDGESFEVGLDAAIESWSEPMRLISRDWGRSRQYRILAQAILNRMAFTGKKNWRILTGLAADHYLDQQYRSEVVEVWRGADGTHQTPYGNINILSVNIMPETAGGFVSLTADPAMKAKMQSLEGVVVDFGTLTTNWLPFRYGKPLTHGFNSIDIGVYKTMSLATQSVKRRAKPSARTVDLESAFLGIQPLSTLAKNKDGTAEVQPLDIAGDVAEAATIVWPEIEAALKTNISNPKDMLLLGIGGGVNVYGNLLKQSFEQSTCIVSEQSQMANVRGLYSLAKAYHEANSRS